MPEGKILEFPSERRGDPNVEREDRIEVLEIVQVRDSNKGPEVLARCELVGGKVEFSGDENILRGLREEEFYWEGEKVTPTDGEKFLHAVKASYRTPYLYARRKK